MGLPHIRFHDLRHTHATLMLKAGVHPKIVQERLGHGSIAVILDTYSHVVSGLQETAAQRFDMLLQSRQIEVEDVPSPQLAGMSAVELKPAWGLMLNSTR